MNDAIAVKPKESKSMPGPSQWTFRSNPDGTVTSTVSGRDGIAINRKVQPWWWFFNRDDPRPPADYVPGKPAWLHAAMWYLRNPIHNANFYVWGVADKNVTVTSCRKTRRPIGRRSTFSSVQFRLA